MTCTFKRNRFGRVACSTSQVGNNSEVRDFLKAITPPFIRAAVVRVRDRNAIPLFGPEYWGGVEDEFDSNLASMTNAYLQSEDFLTTSKFWLMLMRTHLEYIRQEGLESFGNNIARHYFTGTDFSEGQIKSLVDRQAPPQKVMLDILQVHKGFTISESIKHNVLIQLLLNHAISKDPNLDLVRSLNSSGFLFGNHPILKYMGDDITFDKLNSALEVEAILQSVDNSKLNFFLEIGAGSGRTADSILKLLPQCKYVIADIPPASYVSMERLRAAYPEKIIRFAENSDQINSLLADSDSWDILFVLPHSLRDFPDKYFTVTLAIDCLHEMNSEMRLYFASLAESKSSMFYFKIWNTTEIPIDRIQLNADSLSDYGVSSDWKPIIARECIFPADFSEFLFKF